MIYDDCFHGLTDYACEAGIYN